MNVFNKAWKLLKGNPNARVQVRNASNNVAYSKRDFPIHPAALGAANRQAMATNENQETVRRFARSQGQQLPSRRVNEIAQQMVTPEQRMRMKNDSFDLKYRNPNFIHRMPSMTGIAPTGREREERKRAQQAATVRRNERMRQLGLYDGSEE